MEHIGFHWKFLHLTPKTFWIFVFVFPLNSFSYRGSGGLGNKGPWAEVGKIPGFRGRLLCAGAVLGVCRLRHSAALSVARITFVRRRGTWCIFSFQTDVQGLGDTNGLRDSPESLLRASWEPPESLLESFLESILEGFLESFLESPWKAS